MNTQVLRKINFFVCLELGISWNMIFLQSAVDVCLLKEQSKLILWISTSCHVKLTMVVCMRGLSKV